MNTTHQAIQTYLRDNNYQKFSLKAVLFDMDGVLYDSMPDHASSWVKVMKRNGLSMTVEDVYLNEGRIGADTINLIAQRQGFTFDLEKRKRIYREKTDVFMSCPPTSVMPGSLKLLQKITANGLLAMLVTGSGQPTLINRISDDFPHIFTRENMVTAFDVKHGKPHPESYLKAIQKRGLQPDEAIVIENAPLGIESARAAGLFVFAVNTGILPDSLLLDAGANLLFPSIHTLCNEWEQLYDCLKMISTH